MSRLREVASCVFGALIALAVIYGTILMLFALAPEHAGMLGG